MIRLELGISKFPPSRVIPFSRRRVPPLELSVPGFKVKLFLKIKVPEPPIIPSEGLSIVNAERISSEVEDPNRVRTFPSKSRS